MHPHRQIGLGPPFLPREFVGVLLAVVVGLLTPRRPAHGLVVRKTFSERGGFSLISQHDVSEMKPCLLFSFAVNY